MGEEKKGAKLSGGHYEYKKTPEGGVIQTYVPAEKEGEK